MSIEYQASGSDKLSMGLYWGGEPQAGEQPDSCVVVAAQPFPLQSPLFIIQKLQGPYVEPVKATPADQILR